MDLKANKGFDEDIINDEELVPADGTEKDFLPDDFSRMIKGSLDSAFDEEDICVSDDLIARTLAAIKKTEGKDSEYTENNIGTGSASETVNGCDKSAEADAKQDMLTDGIRVVQGGLESNAGRKKSRIWRSLAGVAAVVIVVGVGILAMKNGMFTKNDESADYALKGPNYAAETAETVDRYESTTANSGKENIKAEADSETYSYSQDTVPDSIQSFTSEFTAQDIGGIEIEATSEAKGAEDDENLYIIDSHHASDTDGYPAVIDETNFAGGSGDGAKLTDDSEQINGAAKVRAFFDKMIEEYVTEGIRYTGVNTDTYLALAIQVSMEEEVVKANENGQKLLAVIAETGEDRVSETGRKLYVFNNNVIVVYDEDMLLCVCDISQNSELIENIRITAGGQ